MKLIGLFVAAVLVCAARPADACGNSMHDAKELLQTLQQARLADARRDLEAGRFQEAVAYAKALLTSPGVKTREIDWANRIAGLGYMGLHDEANALPYLRSAVAAFADQHFLRVKLGQAEVATGRIAAGKARLEALANEQLLDADAWVALGTARLSSQDKAGAGKAADEALKLNPQHAGALELKAKLSSQA